MGTNVIQHHLIDYWQIKFNYSYLLIISTSYSDFLTLHFSTIDYEGFIFHL